MAGLDDLDAAIEMRDIIRAIVRTELDAHRPPPVYATVQSIDLAAKTCMVVMTGDTVAVKVQCGSIFPSAPGQVVRLEGQQGDRYIADVLGETENDKTIPWVAPTLNANVAAFDFDPPKYRVRTQNGSKMVQLRGRVNLTGTAVTSLWTMPAGVRPLLNLAPLLVARDIAGGSPVATLEPRADGTMVLVGGTTGVKPGTTVADGNVATSTVDPADTTDVHNGEHKHTSTDTTWVGTDTWTGFMLSNRDHSHAVNGSHSHTGGSHTHGLNNVTFPTFISLNGVQYWI